MNNPGINRRQFLRTTTTAGGALAAANWIAPWAIGAEQSDWPKLPPVRIYKVYAGRTGDYYLAHPTEEVAKFENHLIQLEEKFGDVKFVGGDLIPPTDVGVVSAKIRDAGADAVLLIHLAWHGGDAPVLGKIIDLDLPAALFSQPFSGHGWMYFPQWHRAGKKVVLLPTSDWQEIERVVALMRAPAWLKQTRILVVGRPQGTAAACSAEAVKKRLGAELVFLSNERVLEAHRAVSLEAAEAEAESYVCLRVSGARIHQRSGDRHGEERAGTSPLACRTQFAMSVPDARRMFLNWGADVIKGDVMTLLHRVVFYGDYNEPTRHLADLMGLKIVEEGGLA